MRPPRTVTVVFLAASVACCLGMILVGSVQPQHWTARQMLVLYSFSWTGLAMGEYPARHRRQMYVSVIGMGFLAFLLAK
ncbi:hypothetical protein AB0N07_25140 [Streptomyces sp. NPDC051172]|uniref:hypothetical protein n=1 Tax=Streptomyces sp. NPDC051172 TaxID=3155796 RepID=UPI0034285EA0